MQERMLRNVQESGKLSIRKSFIVCPVCKQATNQAVRAETVAKNLQVWCRNCKAIHIVNIELGQCYLISQCR